MELKHDLLTNRFTRIFHENAADMQFNAPHHFEVVSADNVPYAELGVVNFQEGPIKENGVNGVMNEDLIHMCITRLEHFQNSEFKCRENAMAITKLEEAIMWLRKRTRGRDARGITGTHIV